MNREHWLSWQNGILTVCAIVLLVAPFLYANTVFLNLMILIFLYAGLAQAWNILGGFAGQISLGNAMFFGIGAYTSTWLSIHAQITPWLGALVGVLIAIGVGVVIGWPVFRLRGHYFAIATIALGEIAAAVVSSWDFVGGASGLTIPFVRDLESRPTDSWLWFQFNQNKLPYYFIAFALMVLVALLTLWLDRNKLGFYFRAIKNDQDAARSLGVNALGYKLLALTLSAGFTALLGSFYAQYLLFIDPDTTLTLSLSILISLIAILGGVNTIWGPIVGAFIMIPLGELTRSQFGGSGRAVDLLLYGALIMLISVFQPSGLMGLRFRLQRTSPRVSLPQGEGSDSFSSFEGQKSPPLADPHRSQITRAERRKAVEGGGGRDKGARG